ncbi:hypothetical protein H0H92_000732 [Tricholoma furcatifolium]|nr:hypothetical protein H0H92_000732 [Tricholoma furcatifolium]
MQAGPSSVNEPPQSKTRTRLLPAGVSIMEAYSKEHGINPPLEDRKEMLQRIRSIPGGESYEMRKLSSWFRKRREKSINDASSAAAATLPPKVIGHLITLATSTPYPSADLIETWATLLHVKYESITAWLAERQSPAAQLPTPVSTSPEPAPEYQWDLTSLKPDPSNSPVIPNETLPQFCSAHAQEPPTLTDEQLIDAIREASESKALDLTTPSTLEEFTAMFESYDAQMIYIIEQNEEHLRS